jgi:hypothetical protein
MTGMTLGADNGGGGGGSATPLVTVFPAALRLGVK